MVSRQSIAAVFLVLLSPSIAELLSSSAPPSEFFDPIVFALLVGLYGFGALLIREYRVRNNLGYSSIIILGMAYGVLEEGIAVKSFFNPAWQDIGILGEYGRFFGVNWIWAISLTIYHAIISILIPIAITETLFSDISNKIWVTKNRTIKIILGIFLSDVAILNILLTMDYHPTLIHYVATITLILFLVKISGRVSFRPIKIRGPPIKFWLAGLIWMTLFYVISFGLPNMGIPIIIELILIISYLIFTVKLYSNLTPNSIEDRNRLALCIGPLTLFIILSPIHEFLMERSDDPTGMTLIGALFAFILLYIYRKVGNVSSM